MMLCDTSGLLAAFNDQEPYHSAAIQAMEADAGPFFLSPFVLAELDYLISKQVGRKAAALFRKEVVNGSYALESFDTDDLKQANSIIESYPDASISLADASVVVLARRHDSNRVLTLDQRHFRLLRPQPGETFILLPLDGS
jgi:predicted nucleic acid-binding protein